MLTKIRNLHPTLLVDVEEHRTRGQDPRVYYYPTSVKSEKRFTVGWGVTNARDVNSTTQKMGCGTAFSIRKPKTKILALSLTSYDI